MIDDQLLVGIVLIAVGVAIGLLAYALVLNRREAPQPAETGPDSTAGGEAGDEAQPVEEGETPEEPELAEEGTREEAPVEALEAEPEDETHLVEEERPSIETVEDMGGTAEEAPAPSVGEQRPIVTLMRDDRTGRLTLRVGDRQYAHPRELKGTQDWASIEQASQDLASWLSEVQLTEVEAGARAKQVAPQAKSLVDEVNEILERKLAESGLTHRGVRLIEDREGSVRVYIGIHGYTMDEIPDADIREVIRQAVAEWESRG